MAKGVLKRYPGGFKVLYGGTSGGVKLNRPWQLPISVNPSACPFCRGEGAVIKTFSNGYLHLNNKFTPHEHHTMIIPPACFTENQLRVLGGENEICKACDSIYSLTDRARELWVTAHIGALAGQNVSHLHYHVMEPCRLREEDDLATMMSDRDSLLQTILTEEALMKYLRNSQLVFLEEKNMRIVVESIFRAGQCFLAPMDDTSKTTTAELVRLLSRTVESYAQAFRSQQGLAPDFQLFFKFMGPRLVYGSYLPILNHHGSTESVGAILSGGPFVHPWSPEETLEVLKKTL